MEQTTIAKVRRGVGSARGTQRLKFSHTDANKGNGLFLGHLEDVKLTTIAIGEGTTGMPSFNGCEIPRIVLTFASNESEAAKRRYVTLSFNAVESNVDTIPGGKSAWQVDRIFDYMKHILNVYVLKGRELTEEEDAQLSLTFEDFDEQGQYSPIAVEKVIAAYQTLFENFVHMLSTAKEGEKPAYLDKDGKFIPVWFKLLRYVKNKKGWTAVANGELSFPTFVGEGCIEIARQNTPTTIRLDTVKESIIPREDTKDAKAPTIPGINGVVPGTQVDPMLANMQALGAEAASDMPF